MELLDLGFIVTLTKLTLCVLPLICGIHCMVTDMVGTRRIRCYLAVFLTDAIGSIPTRQFSRGLTWAGILMLCGSFLATWHFFVIDYFTRF